jgi:hypothetical protein
MKVEAMMHIIRATAAVTNYARFLVIGSQAILGHCYDRGWDFSFDESIELDIIPVPDNEAMATLIDGCIGELSMFHETHGYYAHGVSMETGIFPDKWEDRLLEMDFDEGRQVKVFFVSPEDLFISKVIAKRDKDMVFVRKLLQEDMIDHRLIHILLDKLPESLSGSIKFSVKNTVERLLKENKNKHETTFSR